MDLSSYLADQVSKGAKLRKFSSKRKREIGELMNFPESIIETDGMGGQKYTASLVWRTGLFSLLIVLVFLVLAGSLFNLQVIRGRENLVKSESNRIASRKILAPRGVIYDQKGDILARNRPGKNKGEIIRDYPAGALFSQVLGYTGEISTEELKDPKFSRYSQGNILGRDGLELVYEDYLRGKPGEELVEVDSQGKLARVLGRKNPRPGKNLYLTLDAAWQKKVGEVLKKAMVKYHATGAAFVAQRVKDGKVLSLISLPDYDNNLFARQDADLKKLLSGAGDVLFDRAIAGTYPPGSTIKTVVGVAALEEKLISRATKISDQPQIIRVGRFEFPDWTVAWGRGAHGNLNILGALAQSCDIFFYKVGGGYPVECKTTSNVKCQVNGLGVKKLKIYFSLFGLGEKTGIDLPGEAKGLVPDPIWKEANRGEPWFLGNTYHLSIGQGDLLATPIQINNLTTVIASGGILFKPTLVEKIDLPSTGTVDDSYQENWIGPKVIRKNFIGAKHLQTIAEGMRLAVSEGIIYPLRHTKVSVAAKTGTAEFGSRNAKGEYQTHAWVTGFAPFENPQISFTVLLESGGASSNAARVAKEILDLYFNTVD